MKSRIIHVDTKVTNQFVYRISRMDTKISFASRDPFEIFVHTHFNYISKLCIRKIPNILNVICEGKCNSIAYFIQSAGLREAFYNSDWYNNPPSRTKLISICMIRAEKPSMLTAGKFCMLSLNTFTSVSQRIMCILFIVLLLFLQHIPFTDCENVDGVSVHITQIYVKKFCFSKYFVEIYL